VAKFASAPARLAQRKSNEGTASKCGGPENLQQ
jgi:hypothetical protein